MFKDRYSIQQRYAVKVSKKMVYAVCYLLAFFYKFSNEAKADNFFLFLDSDFSPSDQDHVVSFFSLENSR